jgi:glycosyltransferase involved in cell wall biosynthesis
MRILLIPARYPPHVGGLEGVMAELSSRLSQQHEVQVITNRLPSSLPAHETLDGIPVTRLHFLLPRRWHFPKQMDKFFAAFLLAPLALVGLWRAIRRFKPDVVNLHYTGNPSFFVWAVMHLFDIPLVVSLHGADVWIEAQRSPFDRWVFRRLVARAEAVTGCSMSLLEDAAAFAPEVLTKAVSIHNGVDHAAFTHAAVYSHPRPYIASVGRLDHRKGFDLLIDAFARIAPDFPHYDLLIAGSGAVQADLQAQIDRLGLSERVKLVGRLRNPVLAAFYKSAQVVAIPSRREGFGIVALEALATGTYLVVSRVGGLVEALADARVTWVTPETDSLESGLREGLARIKTDAWRADSQHNIHASAHFGWDKVADRYLAVLEKAARGG